MFFWRNLFQKQLEKMIWDLAYLFASLRINTPVDLRSLRSSRNASRGGDEGRSSRLDRRTSRGNIELRSASPRGSIDNKIAISPRTNKNVIHQKGSRGSRAASRGGIVFSETSAGDAKSQTGHSYDQQPVWHQPSRLSKRPSYPSAVPSLRTNESTSLPEKPQKQLLLDAPEVKVAETGSAGAPTHAKQMSLSGANFRWAREGYKAWR